MKRKIYKNHFLIEVSYSPYLGHAYCPAVVSKPQKHPTEEVNPDDQITTSIILDESDLHGINSRLKILRVSSQRVEPIIERHLHHYFLDGNFRRRVLKYWIPLNFASYRIERDDVRKLSKFYRIDDEVVCMF
jgi:hypothetical protein